jgi:LEA14-like dessication related protein
MRFHAYAALVLLPALFFFHGCKSEPKSEIEPEELAAPLMPSGRLIFDYLEADTPDTPVVHLIIQLKNPGLEGAAFQLGESKLYINGSERTGGWNFDTEEGRIKAGEEKDLKAVCAMDLKKLEPPLDDAEILDTKAEIKLAIRFDSGRSASVTLNNSGLIPRIREPEFEIVSIAILQAELINTRFKVKLKIRNPNSFPLTLSSFQYELYGAGRFWADGSKKNIYSIPGNGEAEEDLFLVMNFIEMRRDLLDQVIEMRQVRYRFAGEAKMDTGIEYLPSFTSRFDISGDSEVLR